MRHYFLCFLGMSFFILVSTAVIANPQSFTLISKLPNGSVAEGGSGAISSDGKSVVFFSYSPSLVQGDTNNHADYFVYNVTTDQVARISIASDGTQSDKEVETSEKVASISADGRYIAFVSDATNLVPGDTNGVQDIFVHDRDADGNGIYDERFPGAFSTIRVSIASDGSQANGRSFFPKISGNGRYVVFSSDASNLVANDTNDQQDVFVRDLKTKQTRRVSVSSSGAEANAGAGRLAYLMSDINGDGRFIVFHSFASNLVAGDTNYGSDIFLYDQNTATVSRISVDSNGKESRGWSTDPSISADGRFITFTGQPDLIGDQLGSKNILVRDQLTGKITSASVSSNGDKADDYSTDSHISANGRFVVFNSWADNLVPGDTNGNLDIFVRDRFLGQTIRVFADPNAYSGYHYNSTLLPSISGDGQRVVFMTGVSLVSQDTNNREDVYAINLPPFPLTHLECRQNACTYVAGEGSNLCSSDTDCQPPPPTTHAGCSGFKCVGLPGAGENMCRGDTDCANCYDSDGGNNPQTAGLIVTKKPRRFFLDTCVPMITTRFNKGFHTEFFCKNGQMQFQRYTCDSCSKDKNKWGDICVNPKP